jgi:hypothetical protein
MGIKFGTDTQFVILELDGTVSLGTLGLAVVNDFVTFEPIRSTFTFTPDPPVFTAGFVGTFSFEAKLTNISDSSLTDLVVAVTTLTNGNLLQNKEAVPGLSRVACLVNWTAVPGEAESIRQEIHTAARSLHLEVQAFEVSWPETLVERPPSWSGHRSAPSCLEPKPASSNPTSHRSSPWSARTASQLCIRGASTWMPAA